MNLYILVEGRRTEKYIYPKWLNYLCPFLTKIDNPNHVGDNTYYLFNGNGFPSLLDNHLVNSVKEINEIGKFEYLIVILDTDESTYQDRIDEVNQYLETNSVELKNCTLVTLPQDRCIETWFLGNTRVFKSNPQDGILSDYIKFHNVYRLDPEDMGVHPEFQTHAQFHFDYAKRFLLERNIRYSKKRPNGVVEEHYLNNLIKRTKDTDHLKSFKNCIDFFNFIHMKMVEEN